MEALNHIIAAISDLGYIGLFIANYLMFAVFPLPSQVIVIASGYLSSTGEMNFFFALFSGTLGSFLGAVTNYFIGRSLGIKLVLKYGEYVFITKQRIALLKLYFQKYGWFSILVGLSLPSIGQLISLPAGIGNMNLTKFIIAAFTASFIWNFYLLLFGYFFS